MFHLILKHAQQSLNAVIGSLHDYSVHLQAERVTIAGAMFCNSMTVACMDTHLSSWAHGQLSAYTPTLKLNFASLRGFSFFSKHVRI